MFFSEKTLLTNSNIHNIRCVWFNGNKVCLHDCEAMAVNAESKLGRNCRIDDTELVCFAGLEVYVMARLSSRASWVQ
jgi:hypothetical protein